jgi:GT2 family glycosyltransferase
VTPFPATCGSPLVYVVILNWNGKEDTLACLRSLEPVWGDRTKGVVVDNGSSDGTPAAIRAAYPDMEVIETGVNLGYTGGNNAGLLHALGRGSDYIVLLNNDTVVDPSFIREMLEVAAASDRIGFVSPKIYFLDSPDLLWFAGAWFSTWIGYGRVTGYRKRDRGQYDSPREIDRPCGCALLVSSSVCREAGLLDPGIFLYFDEVEWALRARKHGFKAYFAPKANVWHKVSSSVGGEGHPDAFYYGARNTLYGLNAQAPFRSWILQSARNAAVVGVHLLFLLRSTTSLAEGIRAIAAGVRDYRAGSLGPRRKGNLGRGAVSDDQNPGGLA